jgi:membrane-associated phospholipid phosphatase
MEALFGIFFLFFIANIVLVIWALIDAIKVPHDSMFKTGNKLIWVLVILFAGFIGAIIYFAVGRPAPGSRPSGPATSMDPDRPPPPPPGALG